MKKTITQLLLLAALAMLPMALSAQSNDCDITLPWSENFDSYTTTGGYTQPDCWNRFVACPYSSSANTPNLGTASGHGTVLNMNGNVGGAAGTGVMMIATPFIPAALNNLVLEFDISGSGLMIYAATDTTDVSTFALIGTFNTASMWNWGSFEVHTDTISGIPSGQGFLVFAGAYGTSGYCSARLDNLVISNLNSCERPASVNVENIGPATATVTWPAVDGVEDYRVSYSTVDSLATAQQTEVSTTSATLQGLEPGTTYYVWVQSLCDETSVSDVRTTTFTTQLNCYPVLNARQMGSNSTTAGFQWDFDERGSNPTAVVAVLHDLTDPTVEDAEMYVDDATYVFFTDLDNSHEYEVVIYTLCGDDTAAAATVNVVFHACGETDLSQSETQWANSYPLNTFYEYSYIQMLYPASVFYGMDTVRGMALRRLYDNPNATDTRKLGIWLGNTTADSLTAPVAVTGMTQVAAGENFVLLAQEWDTLMFSTPFVHNSGENVIVTIVDSTATSTSSVNTVKWRYHQVDGKLFYKFNTDYNYNAANPPSSASNKKHLPDTRFVGECNDDGTCEVPAAAIGTVDTTSAEISWIDGVAYGWLVEYRPTGTTEWILADTAYQQPYTITGLTPSTNYEARVGVICGADVRYSNVVSFETECTVMHLPFHFTQAEMSVVATSGNHFSTCWSFSQYIYKGHLTNSHRAYVRNVDFNQWIMLPAIAEPLNGARLRTWAGSSDHGYFKVGIASDDDINTVVWLDTIEVPAGNVNEDHDEYICYLDTYTGTGNRVVISPIVNNSFHYMYFFDFHIEPIEDFCRPANNLTLESADSSSLTVSWISLGPATSWLVYVDGVQVGTATNNPTYTITGLDAYTDYEISVRTLCNEEDTATPVSAVFRTACTGDQCTFTIEGASLTGNGWNGGHLAIVVDSVIIDEMYMLKDSTISKSFSVCADMELSFKWFSGNADDVCSFTIYNAAGLSVYTTADASFLGNAFFVIDSICGGSNTDTVGPGNDTVGPGHNPPDGIAAVDMLASLVLAPNPAANRVTLTGLTASATLSIVDLNGREVYRKENVAGDVEVNLDGIANGVYFVRVVAAEASAVRRLVVSR